MTDVLFYACLLLIWWGTGFVSACLFVGIWSCLDSVLCGYPFRVALAIAGRVVWRSVFTVAGVQTAFAGFFVPAFLLYEHTKRRAKSQEAP